MPEDVQIAVTSPAPSEVVEAPVVAEAAKPQFRETLADLTPAQVRKWKETGKLPEPPNKTDPAPVAAEATSPEKVEPKPPADPAPAKPKLSADDRVQQVLVQRARERQESAQRIASLERELAASKGGAKPTEPVKAAELELEVPNESDYATLAEYKAALLKYSADLVDSKLAKHDADKAAQTEATARAQYEAEVTAGWEERFEAAFDAHPQGKEFEQHVSQAAQVFANSPGIAEYIMTNEYGPQIAEILGRDLRRAHALVKIQNPTKLADALADLKFEARTGKQSTATEVAATLPPKPKVAPVTSPPPRELSTSAAQVTDTSAHLKELMAKGGPEGAAAFAQWKQQRNDAVRAARR